MGLWVPLTTVFHMKISREGPKLQLDQSEERTNNVQANKNNNNINNDDNNNNSNINDDDNNNSNNNLHTRLVYLQQPLLRFSYT